MLEKIHKFVGVVFFLLVFFKSGAAAAVSVFEDNFNTKDDFIWEINENLGFSTVNSGILSLGSTEISFPYYIAKKDFGFSSNDFTIEIKFKYDVTGSMGSGIGIGFTGADGYPFYEFGIWKDSGPNYSLFLYKNFNNAENNYCTKFEGRDITPGRLILPMSDFGDRWHVWRIERRGGVYYVYIDKESNPTPIYVSDLVNCVPENIWFGNSFTGGQTAWTYLSLDYIRVDNFSDFSGRKIIILPGMGASWNERAFVLNQNVADDEWKMTPFVKNYDGLITALETKGLVRGTDFWVWNYDWRRPIADISESLGEFIDDKVGAVSDQKIDLVGHSLGGIVARTWAQDNPADLRLGKVVSLGSPHYGVVKAYEAWSGASFSDKLDWSSIGLKILVMLQKENFETDFGTIRSRVPALRDIIPTFDFVKKNGMVMSVETLETKNLWLSGKNLLANDSLFDVFRSIVAVSVPTKEWINLGERSVFDKVLGVWPDGKPVSFMVGEGDGTVLKKSAKFDEDLGGYDEILANHGNMVDRGISEVFEELGLGVVTDGIDEYDLSDTLVFYLGSPAKTEVRCDDSTPVVDEEGFVVIKNQNYGVCEVKIEGTDSGIYHLVYGKTDEENSWRYFEGEIADGQVKRLSIRAEDGSMVPNSYTEDLVYELIKKDLNLLKSQFVDSLLDDCLRMTEGRNVSGLVDKFFTFRLKKKETKISERVINNLEILLGVKHKDIDRTEAENWLVRARREKNLLDRNTQLYVRRRMVPGEFGSMSYLLLENKLAGAEASFGNENYSETMARASLVIKLIKEVW